MKLVSIVMAYHNRPVQLALTLKSIERSSLKHNVEIIIVDDVSDDDKKASSVVSKSDLDITIIEVDKEKKMWVNPCIAYNIGFERAAGDIVIIQNPESFHVGDVILHAANNVTDKNYLSYSCFGISYKITEQIRNLWDGDFQGVKNILNRLQASHPKLSDWVGWYNHSRYRPNAFHWSSAITLKNLRAIEGFDSRYANGYSWDDDGFVLRIRSEGLKIQIVPEKLAYVVHQQHPRKDRPTSFAYPINKVNFALYNKLKKEYEKKQGKTFSVLGD